MRCVRTQYGEKYVPIIWPNALWPGKCKRNGLVWLGLVWLMPISFSKLRISSSFTDFVCTTEQRAPLLCITMGTYIYIFRVEYLVENESSMNCAGKCIHSHQIDRIDWRMCVCVCEAGCCTFLIPIHISFTIKIVIHAMPCRSRVTNKINFNLMTQNTSAATSGAFRRKHRRWKRRRKKRCPMNIAKSKAMLHGFGVI